MSFATQYADKLVGFGADLLRLSEGEARLARNLLMALLDDLTAQLERAGIGDVKLTKTKLQRVRMLSRQVDSTLRTYYSTLHTRHKKVLVELAQLSSNVVVNTGNSILDATAFTTSFSTQDLRALVDDNLVMGSPARDWWGKQRSDLKLRYMSEVRMGVLQGESNDELVRRIRGTATGGRVKVELPNGKFRSVRVFRDGVMDASTREARALVRTSVQSVSNSAVFDTYKQNKDILKGYEAIVTLDAKTSDVCMARSGGAWDHEGNPLPESATNEGFPGPPPWHFQCRTILGPITFSWDELIERNGGKPKGWMRTVPDSKQSSMDGTVSGKFNYGDWLQTKPKAFQLDKLGPTKYRLFREGRITLPQLLDKRGNPLTVAELRKRYDS